MSSKKTKKSIDEATLNHAFQGMGRPRRKKKMCVCGVVTLFVLYAHTFENDGAGVFGKGPIDNRH